MGQSNSPSENYLFLNVMVNFAIVNQTLTGSALHIEKNQTIDVQAFPRALITINNIEENMYETPHILYIACCVCENKGPG